jgi:hypothetical protein
MIIYDMQQNSYRLNSDFREYFAGNYDVAISCNNVYQYKGYAIFETDKFFIEHLENEFGFNKIPFLEPDSSDRFGIILREFTEKKYPNDNQNQEFVTANHIIGLRLFRKKIKHITDNFGTLIELEELDLMENELQFLPESISNLKKLKKLYLSVNLLKEFPDSLTKLINLVSLNLEYNQIEKVSNYTFRLKNLQILILHHNKIRHLSKSVNELIKLKYLDLSENNLEDFSFLEDFKSKCQEINLERSSKLRIPVFFINKCLDNNTYLKMDLIPTLHWKLARNPNLKKQI